MKKKIVKVLLSSIFFALSLKADCTYINVMNYNVHYGMNANFTNRDKNSSLDQVIKYIKNKKLDIVLLQEFPHGNKEFTSYLHGKRKNPLNYLKDKISKDFFIQEVITRNGNIYKGGKSLVIISRYKIQEYHILDLPYPKWFQTRKALLVKLHVNGRNLWVINTHLCHEINKRNFDDLKKILVWIKTIVLENKPIIFGGDLNFDRFLDRHKNYIELTKDIDGHTKYNMITNSKFHDSNVECTSISIKHKNTFIASHRRIDYIFYKNIDCLNYFEEDSVSSDHYPIFSTYCLKNME
jgi:endonuclease/exonuclease/phosphatase family metal-dependent hydrolase